MVSWGGTESVGPTVGSHKTPTRPPSQVLALPFIPLLSSQQKTTKTHRRGPDILDFRASLDQRQGREPWASLTKQAPTKSGVVARAAPCVIFLLWFSLSNGSLSLDAAFERPSTAAIKRRALVRRAVLDTEVALLES